MMHKFIRMVRYLFENSLKADKYLNPGELISLKFQVSSSKLPVANALFMVDVNPSIQILTWNLKPETSN
jgi:hypothetical protein